MFTRGTAVVPQGGTNFLAKFVYTFTSREEVKHKIPAGRLNLTLQAPDITSSHDLYMLLLDDEAESYPGPSGAWEALSCKEKIAHARLAIPIDWEEAARPEGATMTSNIFEKLRPRWWYFAVADCSQRSAGSGSASLAVKYTLHTTNPTYGWASEFSTDRRLAIHVFLVMGMAYTALAVAQLRANRVLAEAAGRHGDSAEGKAAHPFARILVAGIGLALAAQLLWVVHHVGYAMDGVGFTTTHIAAQILSVFSNFILASLLLLVSQGKCVSYVMLAADARAVSRLLGPFLAACLLLEFWGEYSVSRTCTNDYVYTTPFGWMIIISDLLLLTIYATNLRKTFLAERCRGDGRFYSTWGIVYGAWFLALPVTALLSQAVLAPYIWYIVSVSVRSTVTFLVYAALVVGLWPENDRTYFKLHPVTLDDDVLETCFTPETKRRFDAVFFSELSANPSPNEFPRLLGAACSPRDKTYLKLYAPNV
jgi:hypothetical protein